MIDPAFVEFQSTPHTSRVSLAKMLDKSFNPIQICVLGADAEVCKTNPLPNLLQKGRAKRSAQRVTELKAFQEPLNSTKQLMEFRKAYIVGFMHSLFDGLIPVMAESFPSLDRHT